MLPSFMLYGTLNNYILKSCCKNDITDKEISLPMLTNKEIPGSQRFYLLTREFMEKAMATHSSTLAWQIPQMEEPGGLQSMGLRRVGHDWATSLSLSLSCIGEGNGNPIQCSCLGNPRDGGAWWAAFSGVTESWTRLKRLSSSSSREFTSTHVNIFLYLWIL